MSRPHKEPAPKHVSREAGGEGSGQLSYKLEELEKPKAIDLALSEAFLNGWLTEAESPYRVQGAGHLAGELSGLDGGALLRGELAATVSTECSRCLQPATEALTVPLTVRYVPRAKLEARVRLGAERTAAEPASGFDPRDLDEEPFDGHRLDLTSMVREQLLLALPMKEICREDCQGLCATCGQNRNEKACGCVQKVPDPRWARLQELKLKN